MTLHTPHLNFSRNRDLYYPKVLRDISLDPMEPAWAFGWGVYFNPFQLRQHLGHLTHGRYE